LSASHTL
jgi:alpha-ketoglutarate-dependent taurine dioxygenase